MLDRQTDRQTDELTGYPSIDKPWTKYYNEKGKKFHYPKTNIVDFLFEENRNRKDSIALEYEGNRVTFGRLFEKIDERVHFFLQLNVRPGNVVTMATLLTPDFVYDFYALAGIGAVTNLIDPRTSIDGVKEYINEAGSDIIITNDLFLDKIQKAIGDDEISVVCTSLFGETKKLEYPLNVISILTGIRSRWASLSDKRIKRYTDIRNRQDYHSDFNIHESDNNDLTIVHTGGTTGTPKGVVLTHDNYNALAMQYLTSDIGFTPDEKFMIIMPPWISYGSGLLHMTLIGGMTAQLIPKLDGKRMDEALIKNNPTWFAGVPAHFVNMLKRSMAKKDSFSSVRSGAIGGGAVSAELFNDVERYFLNNGCRQGMIPGYGLTECSSTLAARQSKEFHPGSVGFPLPGATVGIFRIDEETGKTTEEELGYNKQGEICLQTPTMMKGYYNNQELTRKVLVRHQDGNIWIHTGDLGHIDTDGFLFVDGRIKELIIRYDGFKVYPFLIEDMIRKINGIEDVKVVGISDHVNLAGEVPIVFYTVKSDFMQQREKIKKTMRSICFSGLSEYYTEGMTFKRIDKMPLTPIGKIDYLRLKEDGEIINANKNRQAKK